MRAVSLMLALLMAPPLAGMAHAGAAAARSTEVAESGDSGAGERGAAKPGPQAAKEKGRSKGKGEGEGRGVVPRTGPRPGKPPRPVMARRPARRAGAGPRADAPPAHLLRSGFRVTAAGSEVVLQTSAEVGLETRGTSAAPSFVLRRCRALRANDRRSLDTRYFGTAVTSVALRQRGRDLIVHVTLREPATATPRKEQGPDETWSWILAFDAPKGKEERDRKPTSGSPPSPPTATASVVR